jgi:hypothetical protein
MRDLDRLLDALAKDEERVDTPHHVQDVVMRAWDAGHDARRHAAASPAGTASTVRWIAAAGAIAAGLLLGAGIGANRRAAEPTLLPALPHTPVAIHEAMIEPLDVDLDSGDAPAVLIEPGRPADLPRVRERVPNTRGTLVLVGEPLIAGENVRIVRMRVAAARLAAIGVRFAATPDEDVAVEVMVGEDGVARAVRVGM